MDSIKNGKGLSIKAKFLSVFIALLIITLTIVLVITSQSFTNTAKHIVKDNFIVETDLVKSNFESFENFKSKYDDTEVKVVEKYLAQLGKDYAHMANFIYENFPTLERSQKINLLKKELLKLKVAQTGYFAVTDMNGLLEIHPTSEGKSLASLDFFITAKRQTKQGKHEGVIFYDWKNPGETVARQKALGYVYLKEFDSLLFATSYRSEFKDLVDEEFKSNIDKMFAEEFRKIKIGKSGYAFILDDKGTLVHHMDKEVEGKNVKDSYNYKKMMELEKEKANGKEIDQFFTYPYDGTDKVLYYTPIEGKNWYLCVSAPVNEVYGDALKSVQRKIYAIVVVAVILGLIILTLLTNALVKPISGISNMLLVFSQGEGDLTKRIDTKSKDEVGLISRYFNMFVEKLAGIIGEIAGVSSNVASASTQIAASTEELSQTSMETATQSNAVAAAIEEMTASILQIAESAQRANQMSKTLMDEGQNGVVIVEENLEKIQDISNVSQDAVQLIDVLKTSTTKINEVVGFIGEIADQTNLLALNAAIEAARAGEHGRGFAVVADEVRKLAEKTANSVQEVDRVNKEVGSNINATIDNISKINGLVEASATEFKKVQDSAKEIVTASGELSVLSDQISTATNEQTSAADEIASNVTSIAQASEEINKALGQTAQATSDLSHQTEVLNTLVNKFKY